MHLQVSLVLAYQALLLVPFVLKGCLVLLDRDLFAFIMNLVLTIQLVCILVWV